MKVYFNQLGAQLKQDFPLYFLTGDEPLLIQQGKDAISTKLKNQGFSQSVAVHAEPKLNPAELAEHLQAMSLFSDKVIVQVYNPSAKFEKAVLELLESYLANPSQDIALIFISNKLTGAQTRSKWFKLLESHGLVVQIYPLSRQQLPAWISQQMRKYQLKANNQVVNAIADFTEGNLLATDQALIKLQLLYPKQEVTLEKLEGALSDGSRFNVFDLVNAVLLGEIKRSQKILATLQQEGVETTLILWSLTNALRELINLYQQIKQGDNLNALIQKQWRSKQPYTRAAMNRLKLPQLETLLKQALDVDLAIKGQLKRNVFELISNLCLGFCRTENLLHCTHE